MSSLRCSGMLENMFSPNADFCKKTTQSLETSMQNSKHMPIPCLVHDHDYDHDYDHVLHALHHVHGLVLAHRSSHR